MKRIRRRSTLFGRRRIRLLRWIGTTGAAVMVGLSLAACDETPMVPPDVGGGPEFINVKWEHPLPQGNDLRRMSGFADGTFYAVGDGGTILHFDGSDFRSMDAPTHTDLQGIWADDPANVYVCGFNGTLIHFDGARWRTVNTPTTEDLYAVWADNTDDVFVAGSGGAVWNSRGGVWTSYPINPVWQFRAMWGYAHDEVYVGGTDGALLRFDGSTWTKMQVGTLVIGPQWRDMWGPAPGTISIVGRYEILWFNGTSWDFVEVAANNAYGLWGFSLSEQVAVSAGRSTHWIGGVRTWFDTTTPEPLFDVWGTATDNCYAVGRFGHISHFDGTGWQALSVGSSNDVRDLDISPTGDGIAVGADGLILRRDATGKWTEETIDRRYDLSSVWTSDDGLTVAVGRYTPDDADWRQAVVVNRGLSWVDETPAGREHRLFDVWGTSSSDVYAVGWAGEILHYDGITWSVSTTDAPVILRSVFGSSPTDIFAVGRTDALEGVVYYYDGVDWTTSVHTSVEDLCGVWASSDGQAFAVGSLGAILRYDGSRWQTMNSPIHDKLLSVWGWTASDVYACGWGGAILHYDGTEWTELIPATNRNLNAVTGLSSSEIYFASDRGGILFFEGM